MLSVACSGSRRNVTEGEKARGREVAVHVDIAEQCAAA